MNIQQHILIDFDKGIEISSGVITTDIGRISKFWKEIFFERTDFK